ncbi:2-phosphosulfolactate phosphatase [Gloeocapsopsis crepidinum LEGE 06123]|uniref:Probable 2-phosphosulfolactate phosphatase n=1 Tax=Gloeocapsopsis crepidinum LEGE 06123 TaxID=588587 RepID=A0ABR9UKP5_9CHRO|nr:2-phosphosulfolactate phosphatase [Gloeocapsopsis crepidinum]MBE9188862.1 2-phosphosulfolactate phosphatase [Gloeocapsopsis crepidinum LEGE 06123]
MIFDQAEFDIRCEWGEQGVINLAPISDVLIVVDVLSFSTCVEIASNNGAIIFPYQWKDNSALDYALSLNAELVSNERKLTNGYSLSPSSLVNIPANTRLVLPSPNGATLTLAVQQQAQVLTGCLRNCEAVANFAQKKGKRISIIPAGERWNNGSLRIALEDMIGAGAILSHMQGTFSPEAKAAIAVFQSTKDALLSNLKSCISGKELITRRFAKDVELSAAYNISKCVPLFANNAYTNIIHIT